MPSKSIVSVAVLGPSDPNAIRKGELPLNAYYLMNSQRVTMKDHEMNSFMNLKHGKSFLLLRKVGSDSFFPGSDLTSITTTYWVILTMDLTSSCLKFIISKAVLIARLTSQDCRR